MGMSVDIRKYNINDIVQWVTKERGKFGLTPLTETDILMKVKKLSEHYADLENSSGDFTLLWNEHSDYYNEALNFQLDAKRLFGLKGGDQEDGSYLFTGIFPYKITTPGREPLDDVEWQEIFGFVPEPLDDE